MIKVDLFYTTDCEGRALAMDNLKTVLERMGIDVRVEAHSLITDEDARRFEVPGSPTVRINGKDVETGLKESQYNTLKCRTYKEGHKILNAPSKTVILRAINQELPDPVICYCKGVRRSAILTALKGRARTFKEVQAETGVSTGDECEIKNPTGNCCSPFVMEVIKVWKDNDAASGSGVCC